MSKGLLWLMVAFGSSLLNLPSSLGHGLPPCELKVAPAEQIPHVDLQVGDHLKIRIPNEDNPASAVSSVAQFSHEASAIARETNHVTVYSLGSEALGMEVTDPRPPLISNGGGGVQVLDLPLMGLDEEFPDKFYVLHHPATNRYGCFCHKGIHGLAAFSFEGAAFRFAEWIDLSGMVTREVTFDEAREIAKERPMPVVSVMLLDSMQNPKIHYVR